MMRDDQPAPPHRPDAPDGWLASRPWALLSPLLLLLALAVCGVGWWRGQAPGLAIAVVVASPIVALALTPWVAPLLGASWRTARRLAWRDVQGRHFAFKGRELAVRDDLQGQRWVGVRGLRAVLPGLPRDAALQRIAGPGGTAQLEGERGLFVHAPTLVGLLARSHDGHTLRFRHWLEREVVFPSQRRAGGAQPRAGGDHRLNGSDG